MGVEGMLNVYRVNHDEKTLVGSAQDFGRLMLLIDDDAFLHGGQYVVSREFFGVDVLCGSIVRDERGGFVIHPNRGWPNWRELFGQSPS